MIENKRGMSDIVVTLVIILLSLIAIGVVWVVVNNLIKSGTENVNWNAKCMKVTVDVTAVSCNASVQYGIADRCSVTVRKTGTTDALSGVRVVFFNTTANGATTLDVVGDLGTSIPMVLNGTGLLNSKIIAPNKVQITPYFIDDSQNPHDCTTQMILHPFTYTGW